VNNTVDNTELGQLLTQLLRLVSPGGGDGAARNGGVADGRVTRGAADGAKPGGGPGYGGEPGGGGPGSGRGPADGREPGSGGGPGSGAAEPADGGAAERAASDGARRHGGGAAGQPNGGVSAADLPQLSGSEARALIELVKARGIAQGELAGLLGLEKSTVSRLAAGLERKGWVRRGRDEGNQRYVRLYLTAEGGAVAARLWNAWQSRQERILAALTPEERDGLSAGLRGLVRGLAAEGLLGGIPPGQGRVRPAEAPGGRAPTGRSAD
jgi:DNA-binding MarR family transcriptional regulator